MYHEVPFKSLIITFLSSYLLYSTCPLTVHLLSPLCHRRFFLAACDVPSLEDKFNVDQYSDLVTVSKPVIYISIGEIINTHTVRVCAVTLVPACRICSLDSLFFLFVFFFFLIL